MKVESSLGNIRISARKMRLVAPVVKNMPVEEALVKLRFTSKDAAKVVSQVLKNAKADAVHNFKLDADKLVVREVIVEDGSILKRFIPRSRGMAHPILKRTSHIKVVVEG
ncbi:MAG TPA: 50S ribosomal protein L22 [Patescibacteria group bacterium]|nr:50S ribosomal protein L22 [Patescibacteria group bacterium]